MADNQSNSTKAESQQKTSSEQDKTSASSKKSAQSNTAKAKTASSSAKSSSKKKRNTAKKASKQANKTTKSTTQKNSKTAKKAANSNTETAKKVVDLSRSNMQKALDTGAKEARRTHDRMYAMGREGAARLKETAQEASRDMNDAMSLNHSQVETMMNCGNIAASTFREMSDELLTQTNEAFSDQVDISKDFFSCRTLSDVVEVNTRIMRSNIDHFFNSTMALSELMFQYTSEVTEPLSQQANRLNEKLKKSA